MQEASVSQDSKILYLHADNVSTCRSRACIPQETSACMRVRAFTRELNDGRRRMELSKISNPTNPVGELPRQGDGGVHLSARISLREFISSLRARRIHNRDGNVYTIIYGRNAGGMRWEGPGYASRYHRIFSWCTNSTFRSDNWDTHKHKARVSHDGAHLDDSSALAEFRAFDAASEAKKPRRNYIIIYRESAVL